MLLKTVKWVFEAIMLFWKGERAQTDVNRCETVLFNQECSQILIIRAFYDKTMIIYITLLSIHADPYIQHPCM